MKRVLLAAFFIFLNIPNTRADDSSLTFNIPNEWSREYSQKELRSRIKPQIIRIYDRLYKKQKRYEGFPLKAVLDFAFQTRWKDSTFSDVVFTALNGYQVPAQVLALEQDGGYIVFRDLDKPDWEPVDYKKANPGPYYLVWSAGDQSEINGFPWPYQLASIHLARFNDQYPKVLPTGAKEDSAAHRGFELFKGQCFKCHSMNQQGGKVGPDLNAPQSIIKYRSETMVKEFIRSPSKYRYTQMPDHTHLTDRDIDDLIAYFKNKSKDSGK